MLSIMAAEAYKQQTDSDEDCEVYFLKPVNEYNIVDKIKEANKELFANGTLGSKNDCISSEPEILTENTKIMTMRRVTFAANLEDYEPENSIKSSGNGNCGDTDEEDISTSVDISGDGDENSITKKMEIKKFSTIDEEEDQTALEENNLEKVEFSQQMKNNDDSKSCKADTNTKNNNYQEINEDNDEDEGVNEICEEIIVMEMEGGSRMTTLYNDNKNHSFSAQHRRAVLKQTTFDCDQEEQDNKSLMNLLTISDGEEDNSRDMQAPYGDDDDGDNADDVGNVIDDYGNDENANDADSIFDGIGDFDDDDGFGIDADNDDNDDNDDDDDNDNDDDDDDKLSLIVASYLPDDFQNSKAMKIKSSKQNNKSSNRFNIKRNSTKLSAAPNDRSPSRGTTSTSSSFGKRFQLRRRAYSSNSIGTITPNTTHNITNETGNKTSTKTTTNSINNTTDNLIGLKLNYKTCCEYRNSIQVKLPKYTGYLSEYGLSREQLEEREHKQQKKKRFVLEQAIKINDNDIQKMQDNERAFTTWLRNKMRFPINKTRNMFDVRMKLPINKNKTTTPIQTTIKSANNVNNNNDNDKTIDDKNIKKNLGPFDCVTKFRVNP